MPSLQVYFSQVFPFTLSSQPSIYCCSFTHPPQNYWCPLFSFTKLSFHFLLLSLPSTSSGLALMIPLAILLPLLICCQLGGFGIRTRPYSLSTQRLTSSLLCCTNSSKNEIDTAEEDSLKNKIDRAKEDSMDGKVIDASYLMRRWSCLCHIISVCYFILYLWSWFYRLTGTSEWLYSVIFIFSDRRHAEEDYQENVLFFSLARLKILIASMQVSI